MQKLLFIVSYLLCSAYAAATHITTQDYLSKTDEASNQRQQHLFKLDDSNPRFKIINNVTRCQLYSKKCYIKVILNDIDLIHNLRITSMDKKILKFNSIERCYVNSTKADCVNSYKSIFNNELKQRHASNQQHQEQQDNNVHLFLVYIKPKLIGTKNIEFILNETTTTLHQTDHQIDDEDEDDEDNYDTIRTNYFYHTIIVTSPNRWIDKLQLIYIVFFSTVMSVIMGILLETECLIKIIKMPIAVVVGFISQYLFMPLLSYSFIKIFDLPPIESFALFIYGCSPGGSASNNWTIIFNGDIDLSAIMTFTSTMSSIFMMPLWIFTLGSTLTDKAQLKIPFLRLISNLLITILPCLLGLFLSRKFPNLKKFMIRITKRLVICLILSFFLLTLVAKFYILRLITWQQWIAGPLIPWSGFALGAFLAWITRRPTKQIYTISIETGMQNVGIAFMIITLNFSSPESDYAILPLVAVTVLTGLPLWIGLLIKTLKEKYEKIKSKDSAIKNSNNYNISSNEYDEENENEMKKQSVPKIQSIKSSNEDKDEIDGERSEKINLAHNFQDISNK